MSEARPIETLEPLTPEVAESGGLPELLAPAGDWDCAKAAVENGADAIYFGLERFNARMRANNFCEADLPKLMEFLHRRGLKGYVTLNTLVFQNELAEAEQYLRSMITAGVDAVIVQDVGICRMIRSLSPDLPIHASTQMTITSAAGVEFARNLGCHLVVLARECSLKEIEKIQRLDASSGNAPLPPRLPVEVFVHGALCVAYSGQCLTSEALGGRSANRGECAQACRMPYELISDGQKVPLGDRQYLLSPQDLAGLQVLPDLVRLRVASLKIEGRLKTPEYVASITRVYRKALDQLRSAALSGSSSARESATPTGGGPIDALASESRYELEMAFSRGLFTGWFGGINNQALVHGRFGKKRGVFLGKVARVSREQVALRLEAPLKPGDGIVFDAGRPEGREEGARVYTLQKRGDETLLGFGRGDIDFRRVHPGDRVWKTSDPELERSLRQSYAAAQPQFRRSVDLEVHGAPGGPMTVIARDGLGHVVKADSAVPLSEATAQPLTTETLRDQLGRLGGTPFMLGQLLNQLSGQAILPFSELNRLRRDWVAQLEAARALPKRWTLNELPLHHPPGPARSRETSPPELIVLVRTLAQLDTALQSGLSTIYCELEDPKKYREAVQRFRDWQKRLPCPARSHSGIFVAPPRISKPGEEWVLRQVQSSEADGYLVRNYDHLSFFAGCRCVGDYSLNIANALSAEVFKTRFGLERVTASYDLNGQELSELLAAGPPEWFEITLHQHMPMFHMEHCVFCAFLSNGTDFTNCGRPCDIHEVQLRDRTGARHPVKADAGCRNTVFNAIAQTGAEHFLKLRQLGARFFRIEFLIETPEIVARTIKHYQKLLAGEITPTQLWRELRLLNQLGVTRGPKPKG
ncbi:MAG: DUF3656 domain-containing protein [Verrucomicrobiia bacterium]